jgi:RNA polymerase sigma factor (sigma-70 family)
MKGEIMASSIPARCVEAIDPPHNEGRAAKAEGLPPEPPEDLCEKLKAYLDFRSRNVDPPSPLVEAWDDFYQTQTPRIREFLRRSALPEADLEDCLQSVWGEVVAHLADLRYDPGRGLLSTWLITVARNRSVDMLRRRRHRASRPIVGEPTLVDPGPGPAESYERRSKQARVRSVLEELSGRVTALNFQVLHQRMIEGRTVAEVATTLGLTPEQVRFRLYRMKREFRALFERPADIHAAIDGE